MYNLGLGGNLFFRIPFLESSCLCLKKKKKKLDDLLRCVPGVEG